MTRQIPGKTKTQSELFGRVAIGDAVVGAAAAAALVFVLISSLPGKPAVCAACAFVAVLLLLRVGGQANYLRLLHVLSHFGYDRHFARRYTDKMLRERGEGRYGEAAFDEVFRQNAEMVETRAEKMQRLKAMKAAQKERAKDRRREDRLLRSKRVSEEEKEAIRRKRAAEADEEFAESVQKAFDDVASDAVSKRERRAAERARARRRREEERLLRSKNVSEKDKRDIRARFAREDEETLRRLADERDASVNRRSMDGIVGFTAIRDGLIEYGREEYYGAVIEIDPVEFRFFGERRRAASIETGLGSVLRAADAPYGLNLVKIERPIRYDGYLRREYDKLGELRRSFESGALSEPELKARVEIAYDRINELRSLCDEDRVVTAFYYLALFGSDRRRLEQQTGEALLFLRRGGMAARRLDDRELAVFLKYTNALDFDEREAEAVAPEDYAQWAKPEVVDIRSRRVEVNHVVTHNFLVTDYPALVGDAWLAGVLSIPGTKAVVKMRPMDPQEAMRGLDRPSQGLRGALRGGSELLMRVNVYVTAYDIVATRSDCGITQPGDSALPVVAEMKESVRAAWRESGFRLDGMGFEQTEAFIGSQVSALDPLAARGRGIPCAAAAACFPWIYAHVRDENGVRLGENNGIPVFIDFFRRDAERAGSGVLVAGGAGSGRSCAVKTVLANLAADDARIFVLDSGNGYAALARNLRGGVVPVGDARCGRLNPLRIVPAPDDEDGAYAAQLRFLGEFFRLLLPDCGADAAEYLRGMLDRFYAGFGITPGTDLSGLEPADYPTFRDLYGAMTREFQSTGDRRVRALLDALPEHAAELWNGPGTVTAETSFTVFDFRETLKDHGAAVAGAQMLLALRYIDGEIAKERSCGAGDGPGRSVVVALDEIDAFAGANAPAALDCVRRFAARLGERGGMPIVVLRDVEGFAGSEELAPRAAALAGACRCGLVFPLEPGGAQSLAKLYVDAGGVNENEQAQIARLQRGQALVLLGPSRRSTLRIQPGQGVGALFGEADYASRYFSGEQGKANWQDFLSGSRPGGGPDAPERADEPRGEGGALRSGPERNRREALRRGRRGGRRGRGR